MATNELWRQDTVLADICQYFFLCESKFLVKRQNGWEFWDVDKVFEVGTWNWWATN